ADSAGSVSESDETDNDLTRIINIQGSNLTAGTITVSNTKGTATDTPVFQTTDSVFVDFSFTNTGLTDTGTDATADVLLDNVLVTQTDIPETLGSGQSDGGTDIPLGSLAAGIHTIKVVLDSGNTLVETDETDNVFTKTFVVNSPPTIGSINPVTIDEDH